MFCKYTLALSYYVKLAHWMPGHVASLFLTGKRFDLIDQRLRPVP